MNTRAHKMQSGPRRHSSIPFLLQQQRQQQQQQGRCEQRVYKIFNHILKRASTHRNKQTLTETRQFHTLINNSVFASTISQNNENTNPSNHGNNNGNKSNPCS